MVASLRVLLLVAAATSACVTTAAAVPDDPNATARQRDVRAKGAHVMPFSLDKTIHSFDKTRDGGIQRVRIRGDAPEQIPLIRSHLRQIARAFAARDFSMPARIHGADMPGLAALKAARPDELDVSYRDLDDGAEIDYTGHTPRIVAAIHHWFDAQLHDHGRDATTTRAGGTR